MTSEIQPDQITVAVFDRTISKFKEVLLQTELAAPKCRDALKTLNELIHHQETADQMIDEDLIAIVSALLKHRNEEVREQAALLIGNFSTHFRSCPHMMEYSFKNLKEILEDNDQNVRNAAALVFKQLSITASGCECIRDTESADAMILSFIKHSKQDEIAPEKGTYLIYLLESFASLTVNDFGIEPLLGKNAIAQFSKLFSAQYAINNLSPEDHKMICCLSLRVLGNMSVNHAGKQECIDNHVINSSSWFLDESYTDLYEDALNTSLVIMSCSIHLDGKKQIVKELDEEGGPRIIKLMINRLAATDQFPDFRKNLKAALVNIAELPEGFLKICHELSDKVDILDEIFGPKSVKALHQLLPKLSQYENPPEIRGSELEQNLDNYARYLKAMAETFERHKEDAATVAMDETINFAEKIAPFINPNLLLQKEALICLNEIRIDRYNCHVLHKFLQEFGHQELVAAKVQGGGVLLTTLIAEL